MSNIETVNIPLLIYIPELVAWLVGIIIAVLILRRGGERPEKLFLAGCSLLFVARLASPLASWLIQTLIFKEGLNYISRAQTMGMFVSIPTGILTLAGLVCLVRAFWVRFREKTEVSA